MSCWVVIGLVSACGSNNNRGRALYADGRFIEAAEVFEHSEAQLDRLVPEERARYGLYRGMTQLRLGDLDAAARWLHYASSNEERTPGALDPREVSALKQAWQLLDTARARETRSIDPLRGALARAGSPPGTSAPDVVRTVERPNVTDTKAALTQPTAPNP